MHVNPPPNPPANLEISIPGPNPALHDAKAVISVKESSAQTFSCNEIKSPGPTKTKETSRIQAGANYSPEFNEALDAARQALDSDECTFYEEQLGWLSPRAEEAVSKLAAIVSTKYNASRSTDAAKQAFSMKPLTPDEHQAWEALRRSLPPVYKSFTTATSPWRNADFREVIAALIKEPAILNLLEQQPKAFAKFASELTDAINRKRTDMSDTDRGMAITLRFPQCYSTTAHIALAGIWRDESGTLQMSFCHQESVPPEGKGPQPYTGVVYSSFDTSKDYPGGVAPVVESMKLAGPPAVNVFCCPHPEAIVDATQDFAGMQQARQYAPTSTWVKSMGAIPDEQLPETCFNVTHKVLAAMFFTKTEDQPLMPTLLPKMADFASMERDEFAKIQLEAERIVDLDTIPSLPIKDQVKAFLIVGKRWGEALPWDVKLQTVSSEMSTNLYPDQTGIDLPMYARGLKVIRGAEHLTLNGHRVISGKFYTPEEAQMMKCKGNKAQMIQLVTSVPAELTSNAGAKL